MQRNKYNVKSTSKERGSGICTITDTNIEVDILINVEKTERNITASWRYKNVDRLLIHKSREFLL